MYPVYECLFLANSDTRRFCPCHGSHYDICTSLALRCLICSLMLISPSRSHSQGTCTCTLDPSVMHLAMSLTPLYQLNLEIPQYDFNDAEGKLIVG